MKTKTFISFFYFSHLIDWIGQHSSRITVQAVEWNHWIANWPQCVTNVSEPAH
jgi:hypothetical protein